MSHRNGTLRNNENRGPVDGGPGKTPPSVEPQGDADEIGTYGMKRSASRNPASHLTSPVRPRFCQLWNLVSEIWNKKSGLKARFFF